MGLFRKQYKLDEILDDIANTVEAKIAEKDDKLSSHQKDKMYKLHEQKLEMMLSYISEDEPYYRWYINEIKRIKDNHKYKYFRTMTLSGAIAYFAYLDEQTANNERHKLPPQLANLSTLQLLHEVYVRILKRKDLGPLAI